MINMLHVGWERHGSSAPEAVARPEKRVGWFDRLLGRG
jgi:hypothetical protein